MRNLFDTDAFAVAVLIMCLCTYQLATDQQARHGLIDFVAELKVAPTLQSKSADETTLPGTVARPTTQLNHAGDVASNPRDTPTTNDEQQHIKSHSDWTNQARIKPAEMLVAPIRPTVYPRAIATVESCGRAAPDAIGAQFEPCREPECPCRFDCGFPHCGSFQMR